MADARRDGSLALAALAALVAVGVRGVGVAPFVRPVAVAAGVVAAGWERRGVPLVAAVVFVVAAVVFVPHAPWLVAAAAWGLVAYLCLLGCVHLGWGNPVTRLLPSDRR